MTLRELTVDNSVKYIPQSEKTQSFSEKREREIKSNTTKKSSFRRKQNKKLSQNKKKFFAKKQQKVLKLIIDE